MHLLEIATEVPTLSPRIPHQLWHMRKYYSFLIANILSERLSPLASLSPVYVCLPYAQNKFLNESRF